MKKIIGFISIALIIIGMIGAIIYDVLCNKEKANTDELTMNTTVEELINEDKSYFDNMAGKIIFYESRVLLDKPFNETDNFVAEEVVNVFQQNLDTTTNVYEFKHVINYTGVDMQVHKNTSWMEDCPIYTDSLKISFEQAFIRAKQSDLIPSKSRYMVLRNPLGPQLCNAQYIIGNDNLGIMFVDSKTEGVSEHNPAFPNK